MAKEGIMKGLLTHLPNLEENCPFWIWTEVTEITRGPTIDVSKFSPCFMIQMEFNFSILKLSVDLTQLLWLNDKLHAIYLFLCPEENNTFWKFKWLATTLSNQDKKFAVILVDEDGALVLYYEFMRNCHNMKIIVQMICGDES